MENHLMDEEGERTRRRVPLKPREFLTAHTTLPYGGRTIRTGKLTDSPSTPTLLYRRCPDLMAGGVRIKRSLKAGPQHATKHSFIQ